MEQTAPPQQPSHDAPPERQPPPPDRGPDQASASAKGEKLLVCVGPGPLSEPVIRATLRMAAQLRAAWVAAYVETPQHTSRSPAARARLTQNLRLAESLGAEMVTLTGDRLAEVLGAYASRNRITRIILGKPTHTRWHDLVFGSLVDEIIRASGNIDVYVIRGDAELEPGPAGPPLPTSEQPPPAAYRMGVLILLLTTLLAAAVDRHFGLSEVIMVYLLGIVLVALRYGRGVSILISALAVAALDFLFVPPRFTFLVADSRYIFTFIGMFTVGLVIANLTERVRWQADMALRREQRTRALYELTRGLSGERDPSAVAQRAARYVADFFKGQALVLLPGGKATSSIGLDGSAPPQKLQLALAATSSDSFVLDKQEEAVAHLAFEDNALVGLGSPSLSDHPVLHAPLSSSGRCIGVLAFQPKDRKLFADFEQRNLLVAFCDQVAIALKRAQLP